MNIFKNEWGNPEVPDGISVDADILPDGSLRLSGTDYGKSARNFSGNDEYDYGLHIPADSIPQFSLELLKRSFNLKGALTFSKVKSICKNADIAITIWHD